MNELTPSDRYDMDRIADLLTRKLWNELTEEENEEVEAWLAIEENRTFFEKEMTPGLLQSAMEQRGEMDEQRIDRRVYSFINARPPVRSIGRSYRWIAAAVVFLLVAATIVLYRGTTSRPGEVSEGGVAPEAIHQPVILPGSDRARLQLANGDVIELDTAKNGALAAQGGATIIKDGARVSYGQSSVPASTTAYNVLSTPRAGQFQIQLPDGSRVWLNNATTLRYPVAFSGKVRRVELTGEAYFEVAAKPSSPFYVSIAGCSVEALGTSFNIAAYPDESLHRTTLIDGRVRVVTGTDSLELKPGQQAAQTSTHLSINQPDVYSVISWRRGFFSFSDADVGTVMRQIGRWYDVKIRYEGLPATQKLEGSISRNQNLAETLAALELLHIHTKLQDSTVIVYP